MDNAQIVTEAIKKVPPDKAISLLNRVVNFIKTTTSQKLAGAIRDKVTPVCKEMLKKMNDKLDTYTERYLSAPPIIFAPSNTKLIRRGFATTIIIVEQKPTVKTLKFNFEGYSVPTGDDPTMRVSLSLPYLWFAFVKNDSNQVVTPYLFAGNKPLTAETDQLSLPPFTNINITDGRICYGNEMAGWEGRYSNLSESIDNFIAQYWQTAFTHEWTDCFNHYKVKVPQMRSLREWERTSRDDPAFGIKMPLYGLRTLNSFVTQHLQARGTPQDLDTIRTEMERFVRTETEVLGARVADAAIATIMPGFHPVNTVEQLRNYLTEFVKAGTIVVSEQAIKEYKELERKLRTENERLLLELSAAARYSRKPAPYEPIPDGFGRCVLDELDRIYGQSVDVRTKELIQDLYSKIEDNDNY